MTRLKDWSGGQAECCILQNSHIYKKKGEGNGNNFK